MRIAFSTLGCPDWTFPQILGMAAQAGYDGIELRYVQGEEALWKLPVFSGSELAASNRAIADLGIAIVCVDTTCRFHWVDPHSRQRAVEEGERMADLAAALHATGIRVFGETVQPGANRGRTRCWIAECMRTLAEKTCPKGVEVWIETHGDFASGAETAAILQEAGGEGVGAIWDPANCFVQSNEQPLEGAPLLGAAIRNVPERSEPKPQRPLGTCADGSGFLPLAPGTRRVAKTSLWQICNLRVGEKMVPAGTTQSQARRRTAGLRRLGSLQAPATSNPTPGWGSRGGFELG
jgi:sugar phosphate isomerase/epimerase